MNNRHSMDDFIEQIEEYIVEANLLSHTIEKFNFMLDASVGDVELQKEYEERLTPTIQEYKETIKALNALFEQYFAWEKRNVKTRNLRYRRLNKMIKKDLKNSILPISNP